MGYDPNEWTKAFVLDQKDFCIRKLKETNNLVMDYLRQGEHKAALTGLDRILNGLITMVNAGYDFRSHVCFFSWIEANVILFGDLDDAPEHNRIKTAKEALLDARDFAKSETAKKNISVIIDDIERGCGISALAQKYNEDFPNFEIEMLADLNEKLSGHTAPAAASRSAAPAYAAEEKKKPWWLAVAVIAVIVFVVISQLLTERKEFHSSDPIKIPVTDTTTQSGTTEATTETENADQVTLQNLVGNWVNFEIISGLSNPDSEPLPDIRNEAYYTFYEDGRFSVGDACYEEANEDSLAYAEEKDGRYWICIGGGGQSGNYTVSGNQITLITDDSVQYGPSTTSTITFSFDGDTLIIENSYGTRAYKLADFTPNEY